MKERNLNKNIKEKDLCQAFYKNAMQLKAYQYFKSDFEILHIANERITGNDYRYTSMLKSMGMMTGAPDYIILYPSGRVAAIEFKRNKTCKLTERQEMFKDQCAKFVIPYLCTYDPQEAIEFIANLFTNPQNQ